MKFALHTRARTHARTRARAHTHTSARVSGVNTVDLSQKPTESNGPQVMYLTHFVLRQCGKFSVYLCVLVWLYFRAFV